MSSNQITPEGERLVDQPFFDKMAADVANDSGTIGALESIGINAKRCTAIADEILEYEAKIQDLKRELDVITSEVLPAILDSVGITSFKTDTGDLVEVKDSVNAGIAKANQEAAFKWLRDHGHGDLIKNTVTATFAMGEDKDADQTYDMLKDLGLACEKNTTIHAATLKKFVTEQVKLENAGESPEPLPRDVFSVFVKREVYIKRPKTREKVIG